MEYSAVAPSYTPHFDLSLHTFHICGSTGDRGCNERYGFSPSRDRLPSSEKLGLVGHLTEQQEAQALGSCYFVHGTDRVLSSRHQVEASAWFPLMLLPTCWLHPCSYLNKIANFQSFSPSDTGHGSVRDSEASDVGTGYDTHTLEAKSFTLTIRTQTRGEN